LLHVSARLASGFAPGLECFTRGLYAIRHFGAHVADRIVDRLVKITDGSFSALTQARDARAQLLACLLTAARRKQKSQTSTEHRAEEKGADTTLAPLDDDVREIVVISHSELLSGPPCAAE
jgi:hypothetical protein